MTEIVLAIVILLILGFHTVHVITTQRQIRTLIKALMAKDLRDFDTSESLAKPSAPAEVLRAEFIPAESADDSLFEKMINTINNE